MSYLHFLCIVGALIPAAIFLDCFNTRRAERIDSYEFDENARASDMVMLFSPFFSLFYIESFWLVLAGITAITAVGMLMQYIAKSSGRLKQGPGFMAFNLPGVAIILLLIYWFGFNDGETVIDLSAKEPVIDNNSAWWSWWPYLTYILVAFFSLLICKVKKLQDGGVWLLMLALNVLPFFTGYYWSALFLGLVSYFFIMTSLAKSWGTGAGAGSAFLIFYMFGLAASAMVYIVLLFFGFISR